MYQFNYELLEVPMHTISRPTLSLGGSAGKNRRFRGNAGSKTGAWLVRLLDCLALWQQRADSRRHLAALDDRLLRDIGKGRGDIETEIRKPFWLP